jgi:hypothetical protein
MNGAPDPLDERGHGFGLDRTVVMPEEAFAAEVAPSKVDRGPPVEARGA